MNRNSFYDFNILFIWLLCNTVFNNATEIKIGMFGHKHAQKEKVKMIRINKLYKDSSAGNIGDFET